MPEPGRSPLITKSSSPPALKFVLVVGLLLAGLAVVAFNRTDDEPGNVETAVSTIPLETARTEASPDETVPDETVPDKTVAPETVPPETVPPETVPPEAVPPETSPPEAVPAVSDGAPDGLGGDAASPVAAGMIANIGEGWRMHVLAVDHDATSAVLERNQFNDPPPDGSRYTLVNVAMGYYGSEDPTGAFTTRIAAVGVGGAPIDRACGVVVPDALAQYDRLFAGGVVSGNLCFVTTDADADVLQLAVSSGYGLPEVRLDASATPETVSDLPTLRGPQPNASATAVRTSPVTIGVPNEVGEAWTVTVTGTVRDITNDVLATNQFNDPPPDGARFVSVPVVYQYLGADGGNLADVVARVVGDSNRAFGSYDCGVVPNPVVQTIDESGEEVFAGELCFAVPIDEIDSIVLFVTADFTTDARYFATQ